MPSGSIDAWKELPAKGGGDLGRKCELWEAQFSKFDLIVIRRASDEEFE